jgi:hypothetical protein
MNIGNERPAFEAPATNWLRVNSLPMISTPGP